MTSYKHNVNTGFNSSHYAVRALGSEGGPSEELSIRKELDHWILEPEESQSGCCPQGSA